MAAWTMLKAFVALGVMLGVNSLAQAAEQLCLPPGAQAMLVMRAVPTAEVAADLTGIDAVRFMAGFNAMPPPTTVEADRVVVLRNGSHPVLAIVLAFDGRTIGRGQIAQKDYDRIMRSEPL